MKITRHKRMKTYMKFYRNHFQFKLPYQVLIDGTFCHEALQCKLNIKEQVPHYLEDENVRLFTTACVIKEIEMLGLKVYGAMHILKQFHVRKCGHEKDSLSASDCITSMVADGNPHHLIIATTDPDLSAKCRLISGVPLLYVKYNAVILEKPSGMNKEVANKKMKASTELSEFEKKRLEMTKKKATSEPEDAPKKKKKKGPKQPNPLSCLKKKKKPVVATPVEKEGVKKKRKRVRNKNKSLLKNPGE
ncbi:hypothetical protein JTE90_019683 [Oedothorax gibbosus]|uniref:rRNA-processing protein UTP23 homolog n=1 Tax=Oedothorax gibbosus TaxID=931172 RepID=A0AAV6UFY9_9ARAC|nr:hypothetical protein JTE90_019683 [Oedothorax gibbosus]